MSWSESIYSAAESNKFVEHADIVLTMADAGCIRLAATGRIEDTLGFAIYSKMGRVHEESRILLNDVATSAFPEIVAAIGARSVEPREVEIGLGGYGLVAGEVSKR